MLDIQGCLQDYQRSRYLREVHDGVLERRFHDLASNLWGTDAAGNVLPPEPAMRRQVLRRIADVILEQFLRSSAPSLDFDEAAIRTAASAGYRPPMLKDPFGGSPDCFAKFGKREHIARSFEKGLLRIAPARLYDDPSLNTAQIDRELEHVAITANEELKFRMYGRDETGKEIEVPVRPKELFRYMMVPDFYVWCCGLGYDARLFHEFQADAALIIHDRGAFRARLAAAVAQQACDTSMTDGRVGYYDPYTVRREELVPIFRKHIRYLYQNEYRFAWTPTSEQHLKPFLVELGSLHDIEEIIELREDVPT